MAERESYIAVDLGAESGRVMLGTISDKKLTLEEMRRFKTGATPRGDSIRWDVQRIFNEIKAGIATATNKAGNAVISIAFDSWGVDFGLIGKDGQLLEEPFHYRDERNLGMIDEAAKTLSKREIYENTGIQFLQFNTLFQLLGLKKNRPEILAKTDKIIMMADLFAYMLCGKAFSEYTLASTGQLVDMKTGKWSQKLLDTFELDAGMLPEIVMPGTVVGKITPEMAKELGCPELAVVASGSHDTASAVAAVPADSNTNWAYLSSGTWSLLGLEINHPVINDETFNMQFTNEGGVFGTIRLLKNIMGLWLIQECRRHWLEEGKEFSYPELEHMACDTEPFKAAIDTDYHEFMMPGDMPEKINRRLSQLGYEQTNDPATISRIIVDSLAVAYRKCLEKLEDLTNKKAEVLHIVGGGSKHLLLCQCAANILGRKVVTGPVEATASGNILVQAITSGQVKNLAEAREIVSNSYEVKTYQPQDVQKWDDFYKAVRF